MKICFMAPANNYHTKKWCNWFLRRGYEVHVISFIEDVIEGGQVHFVDTGVKAQESDSKKLKYLLKAPRVKNIIRDINPDIVSVHFASSYGMVAALSGVKGYTLSVWGADVYDFPQKSLLHKLMLKYSLHKAEHIFSTSRTMAIETNKYTSKNIEVTPFGVDMDLFNPNKRINQKIKDGRNFVVGTVKTLSPKYGINDILEAVAIINKEHPEINIKLRIAGKGENETDYRQLAEKLEIGELTTWLGFISQEQAATEWANMDVAIVASTLESESFGVSAVEAEACGVPVIITDIPGLMEATSPNMSSIVVQRKNAKEIANAIYYLYRFDEVRSEMGQNARKFAVDNYCLDECFYKIERLFIGYQKDRKNAH